MLPQVLLTAGVVLVSVTTAALVAQAQPTAAPEALESSQLVPRRRPPTALYHASSGLDRQRVQVAKISRAGRESRCNACQVEVPRPLNSVLGFICSCGVKADISQLNPNGYWRLDD